MIQLGRPAVAIPVRPMTRAVRALSAASGAPPTHTCRRIVPASSPKLALLQHAQLRQTAALVARIIGLVAVQREHRVGRVFKVAGLAEVCQSLAPTARFRFS